MTREELLKHIHTKFKITPDFPWKTYPNFAVFRHKSNEKWFALLIDINASKLGLDSEEIIEVLNIKCEPELTKLLPNGKNIFTAYHMNKNNWLSIRLDSTKGAMIHDFLDDSFELTK
ncbi:putative DNA-binding protein, MmcQ/YjbR family [Campylobacter iguaniorum]|uniref:Putative DNA-binding protein, MmcQ/YjbR family n=1 Tax=Campylobacter iguaniorum TaxID=1244531 RepID=A0A076FDG3_9BACT|nr:MmcQ/YjbR family DNA-binding protein [Campylobacter iguaniorum]AII15422.1 putative DNA-binding protein, MmcQ/YjbR family [Campylobacter iguaniorum]ALV25352.1 putative DNA-binding protein, MmcQ/YjbR family [Campylobacter iguaniorum]